MKAVEVGGKGVVPRREYVEIEAFSLVVHSLIGRTIAHKIRVMANSIGDNCLRAFLVINIQLVHLKFLNPSSKMI